MNSTECSSLMEPSIQPPGQKEKLKNTDAGILLRFSLQCQRHADSTDAAEDHGDNLVQADEQHRQCQVGNNPEHLLRIGHLLSFLYCREGAHTLVVNVVPVGYVLVRALEVRFALSLFSEVR